MLSRTPVSATLPYKNLKSATAFYTKKLGLVHVSGSVEDWYLEFQAGQGTRIQLFESKSRKSQDTAATFEVEDLAEVTSRDITAGGDSDGTDSSSDFI